MRHVAVEFVHPVIVGKRALPAIGLAGEGGPLADQVELIAEPDDIAIAFGAETEVAASAARSRRARLPDDRVRPAGRRVGVRAAERRPVRRQELVETLYHVLWELVHVFFEHRGLLEGRDRRAPSTTPARRASSIRSWPSARHDLEAVLDDVRALGADEGRRGRRAARADARPRQRRAAWRRPRRCAARFDAGGKLLALGNGGSATDAMDVGRGLPRRRRAAGPRGRRSTSPRTPAILTAIANDIGVEAIFARQVIAYGREGDALLALSTSGNSVNVIDALAEARRRGLAHDRDGRLRRRARRGRGGSPTT